MPPAVILTPLAIVAGLYWRDAMNFRLGIAFGAPEAARDAMSRLACLRVDCAPACPVGARILKRLPALNAEYDQLSQVSA